MWFKCESFCLGRIPRKNKALKSWHSLSYLSWETVRSWTNCFHLIIWDINVVSFVILLSCALKFDLIEISFETRRDMWDGTFFSWEKKGKRQKKFHFTFYLMPRRNTWDVKEVSFVMFWVMFCPKLIIRNVWFFIETLMSQLETLRYLQKHIEDVFLGKKQNWMFLV